MTDSKPRFSLDVINVASPCPASWDAMSGDARVRFCTQCNMNVYNLSQMSRREAETLVRQREGRLCVRFYRRADGTMLTRDCPVGLRAVRRSLAKMAAATAALLAFVSCGVLFGRSGGTSKQALTSSRPLETVQQWVDEPFAVVGALIMGDVCEVPLPLAPEAPPAPVE